jgi:pilus assembly protein CpaC
LTLDQKIVQYQTNNKDILEAIPLSPNEVQISAKAAGVTQVNLWGEDKTVYTIDLIVYADAQALSVLLRSQFPTASLRVIPVSQGVLIWGYVDRAEHVGLIQRIADEYYPKKVINAVTVGGVQQVLLHVRIMEVSRTKLRRMGFDWAKVTGSNVVVSGVSGLLKHSINGAIGSTGSETFAFSVVDGTSAFFGVLDALRQDNLAKVMAEPTLMTVSGRPASFNVGGEFPVPVPQSLGTISIEYKKYGTQLDFIPIVQGNGMIRLEVRPRVSEIDQSRNLVLAGTTVPGLRSRELETGVELRAGQTLALAGLVQHRVESMNRGLPWISEVPYLGVLFRKTEETANEIELLVMVTPELVEPMNAREVPPCGPGMATTSPNDWELFMKGHPEVPNCCPGCDGAGCNSCRNGNGPDGTPVPDGMIGPSEPIQPPPPEGTTRRMPAAGARTAAIPPGNPATAYNRSAPQNPYSPTRPRVSMSGGAAPSASPNKEPSFIGPVGYDVLQ